MRAAFFLLMGIISITVTAQNTNPVDLKTALEKEQIEVKVIGNEDSPHYYQPIILELTNLTSKPLNIALKAGQIFNAADPDIQDIIVTQDEMIALQGGQNLNKAVFGMCIEEFNGAPSSTDIYTLGDTAEGDLKILAERINNEKAFGIAAQQALWAVTDGRPLSEIESVNLTETQNARNLVMDLVSTSDTLRIAGQPIRRRNPSGQIKRQMEGNFKYRISKESAVTIGFFNQDNIVLKELFNDQAVAAGQHEFEYTLDAMIDPTKYYYVRLIIDGEIKINFEMKPRRSSP